MTRSANWTKWAIALALLIAAPATTFYCARRLLTWFGIFLGWTLRKKTEGRRSLLMSLMNDDNETARRKNSNGASSSTTSKTEPEGLDSDWDGAIGFFHPFCNAGGGGERVLWAAILATQNQWPSAKCFVYTGDHDMTKDNMLSRVKDRFNIQLHSPTITFLYLEKRHWVLPSTWPHFTLLGQSIGSVILAWDGFSLLVPDIFIDTMGFAFASGLSKFLFPNVPTAAYVHYPTISTDMIQSLDPRSDADSQGINAGQGVGLRGLAKTLYWRLFARLYSLVGSSIDVVMTNSTWTHGHIQSLWGPYRKRKEAVNPTSVVYPPVAVQELEQEVEVSEASEKKRQPALIYIAQFRPEKNHQLILESFAKFVKTNTKASKDARLVLVGSVRDDHDSKKVYELRLMVNELQIKGRVEFHLDASWPEILQRLRIASVGVNGMWNEHFGIGVVEYQAAGLISVVHDSGGPKLDIVTEIDGKPTGFHATSVQAFAEAFEEALSVQNPLSMRKRARKSAQRFTEEEFAKTWVNATGRMIKLNQDFSR